MTSALTKIVCATWNYHVCIFLCLREIQQLNITILQVQISINCIVYITKSHLGAISNRNTLIIL